MSLYSGRKIATKVEINLNLVSKYNLYKPNNLFKAMILYKKDKIL